MSSISSGLREGKSLAGYRTRRVSQEAIERAIDEANSHRSVEKIKIEDVERQLQPMKE